MKLNLTKKNFAFMAGILLSVILWSYFLNASGLTLTKILDLNEINQVISILKTSEFLFFVFLFPITIALTAIHAKTEENKLNSFIVSLGGTITGLIISMLLFSGLQEYFLAGIFYLIGLALAVELIHVKKLELKKYVSIRLLGTGIHKTGTILALGFFLITALTVYNNQEMYEKQIDEQLLKIAGGEQTTQQLTDMFTEAIIKTQKQTAKQIIELPQFQALENSSDPNAILFYQAVLIQKDYLDSEEYKKLVEQEIQKEQDLSNEQLESVLEGVKQQMPLFGIITDLLWLMMGFAVFSVFLLLSNTIFYVLTIVYGLIIEQVYSMAVNR